ncbi:tRNA threonylcarbamoyladenosine biosynthesis protein TsaE [Desulfofundulus australicus DSM 11792]|jgi:tRNA threonylcarbamoyladenosine biosynthesis protein TsaE|uniref:tRNA threonylcarbamoyladenosine biosynthesis protein TsaE n=1 Tax=Desulfofundulus australicus DSM 11792 TaxID=1121425 RepID=A0A1M5BQJ4_9FIRM|nr:tRNA (adenosine(37)-N6)-threonylcarbamoyltransferase complex ATPase subunit type 1 TsaE [Desulfofundulus australicus]SHF44695.1 tRNA threonylcarbamoyladenosine biosynthesis protein TsaE [Desulfofundulus australicus DSM 11792]
MALVWQTRSAGETEELGRLLASLLQPGDVLCLHGELGAGKTVLARGIARGLGVAGPVTSPTFTLINEYSGRLPLYHMDVYRLEGPGDMADLGYEDYFYGSGVTLVEWAGRVKEILPSERLDIYLEGSLQDPELRRILFAPRGERYEELVKELSTLVRARH